MDHDLDGRRILIIEDDKRVLEALRESFRASGVTVIGPVSGPDETVRLLDAEQGIDGAVLGMHLNGQTIFPVVENLSRRKIPFVYSEAAPAGPLDYEKIFATLGTRIAEHEGALQEQHAAVRAGSIGAEVPHSRLLEWMHPEDRKLFEDACETVSLRPREIIIRENQTIPFVYFPLTAVASMMVAANGVRPIEVGMIGCEGMTDLVLREGDTAALRTTIIIPGLAMRMPARLFARAVWSRQSIYQVMLAFKEALSIQFAYSALSHGTSTIDARLARWILMLHDRVKSESIPVVHNMIAEALAVRRSGVTTALHVLEGLGAIKSLRGVIIVRDRTLLEQLAAGSYGVPEQEYMRYMNETREPVWG